MPEVDDPPCTPVEDMPTFRIRFRGGAWKIRVLSGVLYVNGTQTAAHVDKNDRTLTIAERMMYQYPLRYWLGFIPDARRKRRAG